MIRVSEKKKKKKWTESHNFIRIFNKKSEEMGL